MPSLTASRYLDTQLSSYWHFVDAVVIYDTTSSKDVWKTNGCIYLRWRPECWWLLHLSLKLPDLCTFLGLSESTSEIAPQSAHE